MIRDSLMQLSWYDMNRENKRLFLIFMLGSAQEVQVSAGGYFNLNMTLFASVSGVLLNSLSDKFN